MACSFVATTLDICDPVVGNATVDWANNGCIAIASRGSILISELEWPNISSSISLKTEYIPFESEKCYYENKVREYVQKDKNKVQTATHIIQPNFTAYRSKLSDAYGKFNSKTDAIAVLFSPSNCTLSSGSILATLNSWNEINLYVQNHPNKQWYKVSAATLDMANQNLPENIQNEVQEFINKQPKNGEYHMFVENMKEFPCLCWSDIYTLNNVAYVQLCSVNKCNILCIWRIQLPFSTESQIELISAKCLNVIGVPKCIRLIDDLAEEKRAKVCIGYVDGRVLFVEGDTVDELWDEMDNLSVTSMAVDYNKASNELLVACTKGFVMLFIMVEGNSTKQCCFNRDTFDTSFKTVRKISVNLYAAMSENGGLSLFSLKKSEDNFLTCDEKIMKEETFPTIPVTSHYFDVSPNQAFIAVLTSFQKIVSNTQIPNDSCLSVIPFLSPADTFECLNDLDNMKNYEDIMFLLCFYLTHQVQLPDEFSKKFLKTPTISEADLSTFWFSYSIRELSKTDIGLNNDVSLEYIEKVIVAKQMIHILDNINLEDIESCPVPVMEILDWLSQNGNLLTREAMDVMSKVSKQRSNMHIPKETCKLNGTELQFSSCGTKAIVGADGSEWDRCCLTFIPIQFNKIKRCKFSKKCSLVQSTDYSEFVNKLLEQPSPYSGLQML